MSIDISVITPSLNMLSYLKRCHASVADQQGVTVEHIIMDGGSTDGTVEWLRENPQVIGVVQKDNGMYDAINKGLSLARGNIISYLNCDEQYLPGALSFVKKYMERHPEVDILFGDFLVVRPDGSLVCFRKGYPLRWFYIFSSYLYAFSCAMFFRRRLFDDGLRFNEQFKDIGDADFVVRALRSGYKAAYVRRYLAVFTMTGINKSASSEALLERKKWMSLAPLWIRILKWPLNWARLFEKLIHGSFWEKMPLQYAIYVSDDITKRKVFYAEKSSFRWRGR
ncbi:MAG: glycosyltransferase family 2 protein [Candidatus Bathyarchaeia archaeon]